MKAYLLAFLLVLAGVAHAQKTEVAELPTGTYQIQNSKASGLKGDLVLVDDSHYKLSNDDAVGEYKFSTAAQRVLFVSGSLKGAFARTIMSGGQPAILLPQKENATTVLKQIQSDLQAFYKKD